METVILSKEKNGIVEKFNQTDTYDPVYTMCSVQQEPVHRFV